VAKTEEVLRIIDKTVGTVTGTLFGEITGAVKKFSIAAEKGTVVFLQAVGAVFIVLSIVLTFHSESVVERFADNVLEHQFSHPTQSSSAKPTEEHLTELKIPFEAPQFMTLVGGGIFLMLTGSLIDILAYRWKIESYRQAQTLDFETYKLNVSLSESGLQAIERLSNKPTPQPKAAGGVPDYGPAKRRGRNDDEDEDEDE